MIQLWENEDFGFKQFAFLDTVTDRFVRLCGIECFESVESFTQAFEDEGSGYYGDLERFTSKLRAAGWEVPNPKEEVMRTES